MLWPVAKAFGIDPVHFGILVIVNASIGSITPPLGGIMYVVCNLLKVSIPDFVKASLPFYLCLIILLLLMMLFPKIVLFLPNLVYA